MYFSYQDYKRALYVFETLVGVFLIGVAVYILDNCEINISCLFSGIVLVLVGCACILFGIEACYFREDPDIWR